MNTQGNTILITGGAGGVGLALATELLRRGNEVIVCGRDIDKLARARATHPGLHTVQCDIRDPEQQQRLLAELSTGFPHLNILINNAGIQNRLDFNEGDFPIAAIRDELITNAAAQMELSARLLPLLRSQEEREATLLFIGSALAVVPKQSTPIYNAAKAALHNFIRSLRYQLEGEPVRIVEVIPDLVDTAMTRRTEGKKIRPEQLAEEVMRGLERDRDTIPVGRSALLLTLHRVFPSLAYRLLKSQ